MTDDTPEVLTDEQDIELIPGYVTTKQAEKRWPIKANSWVWNIRRGRIPGARKFQTMWLMPIADCEAFIESKESWKSTGGGKSGRDRLRTKRQVAEWRAKQAAEGEQAE